MPSTERIDFRIDPDKKAVIQQAADMEGLSTSDFIKRTAYLCAVEKIHTHLHLRGRDAQVFAQSIIDPPKPNTRLKRAVRLSGHEAS